jgi:DNA-binding NarL/FixJ family response regulator
MERVRVGLLAADQLSLAGPASYLESRAEVAVLRDDQRASVDVTVVVTDRMTSEVMSALRRTAREIGKPVVLVSKEISEAELRAAVECGVVAVLPRNAATGDRLVDTVLAAAAGCRVVSPIQRGELFKRVQRLQQEVLAPRRPNSGGRTPHEIDVLRLEADGHDAAEITNKLWYSERTIKTSSTELFNASSCETARIWSHMCFVPA